MAELEESGAIHSQCGKKRGGVRAKKMATRMDMTPMVDLGFLLVTFFILTTTMNRPKAMELVMPPDTDPTPCPSSEAFTILLAGENEIYYYSGMNPEEMKVAEINNIRSILLEKDLAVKSWQRSNERTASGPMVMIKPTDESKYINLIDILDEMKISGINRYAIVDVTKEEIDLILES